MSSLVVSDFKKVTVKSVNILEREGKKPLAFVNLVDLETFETTGEMLYLKKDVTLKDLMELKSLERKNVKATLQIGMYNNRPSINIVDLVAV